MNRVILTKDQIYILSAVFGFLVGVLTFSFYAPNYFPDSQSKRFKVEQGERFKSVAERLEESEIIPNAFTFKLIGFITGSDSKIKAGEYIFKNGMTYFEILDKLKRGGNGEQKLVTIQEGIWQHKLAKLLSEQLDLDEKKIMELSVDKNFLSDLGINAKTLEGYLLPETYYFHIGSNEENVLIKLHYEMEKLFDDKALKQMEVLGMSKHEILTMASIIDGESNHVDEFKRISGVYYNRLKKGMPLQADPTVQYLIRERKRNNRVLYKDLEINSPYNTYKYTGLPPGPINNPGKSAVEAALYPEEHDYYFFVASGRGDHVFAKTNREHSLNVSKYRRWRESQK